MADLGQIESATIQAQVYQRLREGLFDGAFSPGQSLTIRNLAAGLGTSPMPVREALQRLVAEHALVQLPNRTFQVTPFTTEMFRELTRVRMSVEGLAAGEAARRTRTEDVRTLQKLNKTMIRGIEKNDSDAIMKSNFRFHFTLYELAQMPQLMDIINGLWLRASPYLMNAHRNLEDPQPFFRAGTLFHDRMIDACIANDHRTAARAMACDIWYSARYFRRNMELVNTGNAKTTKTPKQRKSRKD